METDNETAISEKVSVRREMMFREMTKEEESRFLRAKKKLPVIILSKIYKLIMGGK
jgi:hypothetical protein